MDGNTLDISKIPKFQFEIHNEELTNCIKQLSFQAKTHDKHLQKVKKDVQSRPTETAVADTYTLINACIDIDPALLKNVVVRQGKNVDGPMAMASNKLGHKIGQMSQILRILFQKMQNLEKNLQTSTTGTKTVLNQKVANLQSQLDDFKKTQNKENRSTSETIQLNLNKYEEQLREVESKTLWQINDCKTKLNDRVNQQFVRDVGKESEARIITKLKESMGKNHIDPQRIDQLQTRCLRLEKDIQIKLVEVHAQAQELKTNIEHSVASKKELANDRLQSDKKIGNLQVQAAEQARKIKNIEIDLGSTKEDLTTQTEKQEENSKQLGKIGKMVTNLKISDDFQKLMQNLDPHKICEIDNTLTVLAQRDLKIEKEVDALQRYQQKLKQKVEICNMLNPTDQKAKLDKQELARIFNELVVANPTFKKIQTFQGQLYEFKAYGDMINEINKRIGKIQKQFDIQGVIYNIKGLEQYIKKELLVMTTKLSMFESQLEEQKRKRPISARKSTDGKMTTSISYKKLMPVDCISCFQNPVGEKTAEQRRLFKY